VLPNILRTVGVLITLVAVLHLLLGPQAEVMLGSGISEISLADATLDSQNRFYGVAFFLYGVILIYCASDIGRYRDILNITIGVFFLAGLARIVSIIIAGWPTWPVVILLVAELLLPPTLFVWIRIEVVEKDPISDA